MPDRYDIFVSYAEADADWVQGYLLPALRAAGVRYLHEPSFALGAPRIAEFERAVRDSDRTLLVLTPAYYVDGFTQFADLLAQTYGLETATWPVIPMILRKVQLPPRLSILKGLDATDPAQWARVIERLCEELKRPGPEPEPLPPCPYLGMAPFSEDDHARFFGRDQEIQELRERLRLDPFVAVIGPSGSGKSSLVHAGLVPSLRERGLFGAGPWVVCTMRPGERPLDALADALDGNPGQPAGAARRLLAAEGVGARLLLVVDQLEELFTIARRDVEQFQLALLSLAELPGCHVVVTVRADFYPQLMAAPLWPSVRARRVEVLPLDGDALGQAILRPAENVGVFVETALIERLLRDAAGEPGALPLVQETLVLLWERLEWRLLPLSAYVALVPRSAYGGGSDRTGLQVAMARRADAALADLSPTRQAIARRILLRLVQSVEGRDEVRRQRRVAALRSAGDAGELEWTLAHLTRRRLLTLSGEEDDGDTRVDLAHEVLISGWPVLQTWISERRSALDTRRRLEAKAAEWVRLGREAGGRLDEVELREAERWLDGPDAAELGVDEALPALVRDSREALERARREREEARREREEARARQLAQARALAAALARGSRILRRMLVVVALVAVVAFAAAGLALWQRARADQQTRFASSRALASQARVLAGEQLVPALLLSQEALRSQPTVEARGSLLAALERNPRVTTVLHGHVDTVNCVAVSPDGRTVAAGGTDGRVLLWDRASGRRAGVPLTGPGAAITSVAFSPDGRTVAAGSLDRRVTVWEVASGRRLEVPAGHAGPVRTVAFSPDGRTLVSGGDGPVIALWDPRTLSRRASLGRHTRTVRGLAFSRDGSLLASASDDRTIILWEVRTWTPRLRLRGHTEIVRGVAFSPDGRTLASGSNDHSVRLWSVRTGRPLRGPLLGHRERVFGVAFSPDGRTLASAGRDHVIGLWDPVSGRRLGAPLTGHTESVRGVAFTGDGTLVSASNDRTVIVWDLARRHRLADRLGGHPDRVRGIAVSPDGRLLAAAGEDRTIALWDLQARARAGPPLRGHAYQVTSVAFSPDGRTLASGGWEGRIMLWDPASGQQRRTLPGHDGHAVFAVAFSPDGRTLASAGADRLIRLWDVASGQLLTEPLAGHESWVLSLAFSPDGRMLASGSWDLTIRLWDLADPGGQGEPLTTPASAVTSLAFAPDGRYLLAGNIDDLVTVWDLTLPGPQRRPVAQLSGHVDEIRSLALSPDGHTLASSSADGTVILWDMATRQRLGDPLQAHAGPVGGVAFTRDGRTLATGGDDGEVLLWDVDVASWRERACRVANRNLSELEWRRLVGADVPYQRTCPGLPAGDEAVG